MENAIDENTSENILTPDKNKDAENKNESVFFDTLDDISEIEMKEMMKEMETILEAYVDKYLINKLASDGCMITNEPVEMYRILGRASKKQFMRDFSRNLMLFLVDGMGPQYFGSASLAIQRSDDPDVHVGNFSEFITFLETHIFARSLSTLEYHHKLTLNNICRLCQQTCCAVPLKMLHGFLSVNEGLNLLDYEIAYQISPERSYPGGSTQMDFIFSKGAKCALPQLFTRREAFILSKFEDPENQSTCMLEIYIKPIQRLCWSAGVNYINT